MRKNIFLLAAMLLLSVGQVWATDYKYLILENGDGGKSSLPLSGLKITFDDGSLVAAQGGNTTNFALSALSKMYFSDDIDAVHALREGRTAVSLQGATLQVKAPAGTLAKVYDASGRLVMSTKITSEGTPASVNLLRQGIYVVKAGNETLKILVK